MLETNWLETVLGAVLKVTNEIERNAAGVLGELFGRVEPVVAGLIRSARHALEQSEDRLRGQASYLLVQEGAAIVACEKGTYSISKVIRGVGGCASGLKKLSRAG